MQLFSYNIRIYSYWLSRPLFILTPDTQIHALHTYTNALCNNKHNTRGQIFFCTMTTHPHSHPRNQTIESASRVGFVYHNPRLISTFAPTLLTDLHDLYDQSTTSYRIYELLQLLQLANINAPRKKKTTNQKSFASCIVQAVLKHTRTNCICVCKHVFDTLVTIDLHRMPWMFELTFSICRKKGENTIWSLVSITIHTWIYANMRIYA